MTPTKEPSLTPVTPSLTPSPTVYPYKPRGPQKNLKKAELLDLSLDTIQKTIDLFIKKIGTDNLTIQQKKEVSQYMKDMTCILDSYYFNKRKRIREKEVMEALEAS